MYLNNLERNWKNSVCVGAGSWRLEAFNFSFQTKKIQQFQFQTSGILLFTIVQKLYGPKISLFFPFYATSLGQFTVAFHFFWLHRRNRSLHVGPFEKVRYLSHDLLESFLYWTFPKKTKIEYKFKRYIIGGILDLQKKSYKIREASI